MEELRAIDLFAGAGGLTLAAQQLGIRVLAAVENYSHACDTYERNFVFRRRRDSRPRLYREDILNRDLPGRILSELSLGPGEVDILMGGPPCQGYSTHRINGSGIGDPRNDLLIRYFDFVETLRPKAFVVENVPGLLWPRHADYLSRFKELAGKAGYKLHGPEILNARDFGVPQNRKRIFIVGILQNVDAEFSWPEPTRVDPSSKKLGLNGQLPWATAAEIFKTAPPKNDPNNVHMMHSAKLIEVFASTPKNGGSRVESCRTLRCHEDHTGHKDVYGRIDPSKPGPTMTTACINPSKGRFVHPTSNHGITLRQAARFQCFPDTFVFSGGLIAGGIQVGNAVPIALGLEVLDAIKDALAFADSVPRGRKSHAQ